MFSPCHVGAIIACILPPTATAQSVGVSLSALVPLPVQVTDGATSASNTWPAGPLPLLGTCSAVLPGSSATFARVGWQKGTASYGAEALLTHDIHNPTSLPNFTGRAGPHEFLVEFTSATPRSANLLISRTTSATPRSANLLISRTTSLSPGSPWPTVQIDFDNDGVIDIANLPAVGTQGFTFSFGPQPLRVRVVVDCALGPQTSCVNSVRLYLEPENNLVIHSPIGACFGPSPSTPTFLQPSFDNQGVDLLVDQSAIEPSVMVFGFGAQPTVVGMNWTLPCILLPTPDVVLYVPSGQLNLPLPANVRPVTFFAQGVRLLPLIGLVTTDGYSVSAL